ncbi:MAG: chemotaxis protein CheW [Bacteroidota bacterium]|jgi:purine-binding chemotaxis protein CheW|nr:chemotaxis protein CheW [Bacteroidota bacterium]
MSTPTNPERRQTDEWGEILQLLDQVKSGLAGQARGGDEEPDEILRLRARQYARQDQRASTHVVAREDLVVFTLGTDTYGIDCSDIEEVIPLQNLVALPYTNKGILGISSLRGILFAVVDLKRILNIPASELTTMHRVLIVRHARYKIGFLVDSVQGMRSYDRDDMQELPSEVHGHSRAYLQGLIEGSVMLLNTGMVLRDPMVAGEDRGGN